MTGASHPGDAAPGIDVVLVTGLSGAGRGTAAKVLEDLGWYVAVSYTHLDVYKRQARGTCMLPTRTGTGC